jgi:hypothetical protein
MVKLAAIQAFVMYPLMSVLYFVLMVGHIVDGDALGAALNTFTWCCWAVGAGFWFAAWRHHRKAAP